MKKRIAIYGGTELSAAESWFVVSLTHALLSHKEIIIVTGGFLFWPEELPGAISTDFSVLQGAEKYAIEKGIDLKDCLETWLPDPNVETDTQKKDVVRFKKGVIKELKGESAQARRFSMVRDVDVLITIKGKKHTSTILDFAKNINKPAFPLAFTGGDSHLFWNTNKQLVKEWFEITDDFAKELEIERVESWTPFAKDEIIKKIIKALDKGVEKESFNEKNYKKLQKKFKVDKNSKKQLSVFLSYSRKDEKLKDLLNKKLFALKRTGKISVWHDKEIEGGSEWEKTIKEELKNADIILLLISPAFIASEYIMKVELQYALEKHELGKSKVIPVFLRKVNTEGMPFEKLQGYISKERPIASFPEKEREKAFLDVVKSFSRDIRKWLKK